MDNRRTDAEGPTLLLGAIVNGGMLINTLTLYFYSVYNGLGSSIIIIISLFSFLFLWEAMKNSDMKGMGCALAAYFIINIMLFLINFIFNTIANSPQHWGFG